MREIVHIAWHRFSLIGSVIGDVQSRVLMTLFYFTILMPFGIGSRIFSDPLRRSNQPHWLNRPSVPDDIESARLQG